MLLQALTAHYSPQCIFRWFCACTGKLLTARWIYTYLIELPATAKSSGQCRLSVLRATLTKTSKYSWKLCIKLQTCCRSKKIVRFTAIFLPLLLLVDWLQKHLHSKCSKVVPDRMTCKWKLRSTIRGKQVQLYSNFQKSIEMQPYAGRTLTFPPKKLKESSPWHCCIKNRE